MQKSTWLLTLLMTFSVTPFTQAQSFREEQLRDAYTTTLNPFLESAESQRIKGTPRKTWKGSQDIELQVYHWQSMAPKARILILTGFTENVLKYRELAYEFHQEGYAVSIYEHRGHGRSDRLLRNQDPQKMFVDDFDDYVRDLDLIVRQALPQDDVPLFIFAHSMGAAVAVRYIQQYQTPVAAAFLSSPMFDVFTDGYPRAVLEALTKTAVLAGQGSRYVIGRGPIDAETITVDGFGDTTSQVRFDAYIQDSQAAGILQGNATFQWTYQALRATADLMQPEKLKSIRLPIFIAQASEDTVVRPEAQTRFCAEVSTCELETFEGRHALYYERDQRLVPYLERVLGFFEQQLSSR